MPKRKPKPDPIYPDDFPPQAVALTNGADTFNRAMSKILSPARAPTVLVEDRAEIQTETKITASTTTATSRKKK